MSDGCPVRPIFWLELGQRESTGGLQLPAQTSRFVPASLRSIRWLRPLARHMVATRPGFRKLSCLVSFGYRVKLADHRETSTYTEHLAGDIIR